MAGAKEARQNFSYSPNSYPGQATLSIDEKSLGGGIHGTIIARDSEGNIIGSAQGVGSGPGGFSGKLEARTTVGPQQPQNTDPTHPSRTYFVGTEEQVRALLGGVDKLPVVGEQVALSLID